MSRMVKRRGVVLSLASFSGVSLLSGFGTLVAKASALVRTPHKLSRVIRYIDKQPLFVTISHKDYDTHSAVTYAEIKSPANTTIGYWLPFTSATGQSVCTDPDDPKKFVITVAFDTKNLLTMKPGTLSSPSKSLPAPVGTGSILCINTNVDTDECPTADPILLDPVPTSP